MNVVSFVNKKGGVGKTTICLNFASLLAAKGKKILLIDNDGQCNITKTFSLENSKETLYDVMLNEESLFNVIQKTRISNLDLVPNSKFYQDALMKIATTKNREYRLKTALEKMKLSYDYIFIDCNPSLDLGVLNALAASNQVIVPIDTSAYALEGLTDLNSFINAVNKNINNSLEIKSFILNNIDRRTKLHAEIEAAINQVYPGKLAKTTLSLSSIFAKMQFKKQTLADNKLSKSYLEYNKLLKELNYFE